MGLTFLIGDAILHPLPAGGLYKIAQSAREHLDTAQASLTHSSPEQMRTKGKRATAQNKTGH
jgi:hypothetical protein